jgi:hypothetical protein
MRHSCGKGNPSIAKSEEDAENVALIDEKAPIVNAWAHAPGE